MATVTVNGITSPKLTNSERDAVNQEFPYVASTRGTDSRSTRGCALHLCRTLQQATDFVTRMQDNPDVASITIRDVRIVDSCTDPINVIYAWHRAPADEIDQTVGDA